DGIDRRAPSLDPEGDLLAVGRQPSREMHATSVTEPHGFPASDRYDVEESVGHVGAPRPAGRPVDPVETFGRRRQRTATRAVRVRDIEGEDRGFGDGPIGPEKDELRPITGKDRREIEPFAQLE